MKQWPVVLEPVPCSDTLPIVSRKTSSSCLVILSVHLLFLSQPCSTGFVLIPDHMVPLPQRVGITQQDSTKPCLRKSGDLLLRLHRLFGMMLPVHSCILTPLMTSTKTQMNLNLECPCFQSTQEFVFLPTIKTLMCTFVGTLYLTLFWRRSI